MQSSISIRSLINKGQYAFYSAILEKTVYFILFIYLARKLSVDEYGTIVVIFSFANILSSFFEFGLGPYFQRETAMSSANIKEQLNTALYFKLLCFIPYGLIAFLYFKFIGTAPSGSIIIITALIYIYSISNLLSYILFGLRKYYESFKSLAYSRIFFISAATLLLIFRTPYIYILISLLCGVVLQAILLTRILSDSDIRIKLLFDAHILKKIFSSSLPIGIGITFVWIYDKADVLLIQNIIGNEAVSYYAVAYSIYKLPQVFIGILLIPLYTELSNRFSSNGYICKHELSKPIIVLVSSSIALILILNIISGLILKTIYGIAYEEAGWMLSMLSLSIPALFLNNLTGVALNSIRCERKVMYSAFFAFIANISLNIIFLKWFGIIGAIISTICTEYLILSLQLLFLAKSKGVKWQQTTS